MPQITIIQPAAPQAPPPSPPASEDTQQFSPHLDKAIANRKDQPSSRESGSKQVAENKNNSDNKEISENIANNVQLRKVENKNNSDGKEVSEISINNIQTRKVLTNSEEVLGAAANGTQPIEKPAITTTNLAILLAMGQSLSQTVSSSQTGNPAIPILNQHLTNNSPLFEFLTNNFKESNNDAHGQPLTPPEKSWSNYPEGGLFKSPIAEAMGLSIAEINTLLTANDSPERKPENPFLLQLQKIIANSNESGNLSITVKGNTLKVHSGFNSLQTLLPATTSDSGSLPLTVTSTDFTEFDADGPMGLLLKNPEMPVEKPSLSIASVRHSIHQQYYEGKITPQNDRESQTPSENSQQGSTFSPQTAPTGEGGIATTGGQDQTNTFAQPLALTLEGPKMPAVEGSRPVTLPSGTVVHQEEVIRQIAERFQISRRDLDTRVNIQLHPAELGELKINLSVKEGSVRANVFASSQYAQEIIEKNMVRLRTILEGQGFTIGEITVTSKSDTAGDFNLFERQLFGQDDYAPHSAKNSRNPETLFTLEDPTTREQTVVTGVNVKI
ncbi:MAG: flagellar hook-length control protein FliK [Proteobacteria bacterium]|nr:flagellar hook-length control protein FliK [Pseudomonadota bacterium]